MEATASITTASGAHITATVSDGFVEICQDGVFAGRGTMGPHGRIEDCSAQLGARDGSETEDAYLALEAALADPEASDLAGQDTIARVSFRFLGGNLLGGREAVPWDVMRVLCERYAEASKEALRETFPGAMVVVSYDARASGYVAGPVAYDAEGCDHPRASERAAAIVNEVWERVMVETIVQAVVQ